MNKLIFILILIFGCNALFAQIVGNTIRGSIDGDTLKADISPYHVIGDVIIIDLTIEPGVTLLFDSNWRFEVNGVLNAKGFFTDSIYFKPESNNIDGWRGISLKKNSLLSTLIYCRIEGSNDFGVKVDECQEPIITNCKISGNDGNGLHVKKIKNQIRNCLIENNDNGVFLEQAQLTVHNSIITKNINVGIFSDDNEDSLHVINSVIADNQGTGLLAGNGYVFVKNSIIYYNGIEISTNPSQTHITYSDVRRTPVYQGIGNINAHPQFNDLIMYTLSPSQSLCIDAGDSDNLFNDLYLPPSLGNERNDMGAYGGPFAGLWYPPLYIQPDSLNFGKVSYDSTVSLNLNVENYRDTAIVTDSIYLVGSDTSVFNSDTDYLNINVLDSANLNISFTPDHQGVFSVVLVFETVNHGKIYVPVSGQGVVSEFNYAINYLDFETVTLGDSSTLNFPIINSGDDTLKIYQIHTTKTQFKPSHTFMNINPDNSRDTLHVTFIPDSIDMLTDSLIMFTNDPDEGRLAFPLYGQGLGSHIDINNETIDYGSVFLTRDSLQTLLVSNNGNDSLYINDIQVLKNDTASTSFRFANDSINFPLLIKQDSTYHLDVIFEPILLGADSANLVIQSNDYFSSEINVAMVGYGIASQIQLSQSSINFGLITFNTYSLDTVIISNNGNYTLNINPDSLLFVVNQSQLFSVDSISSYQIPAGNSAYLYIKFFAGEEGIKQDSLQIVCNDLENPKIYIDVSGESQLPQIAFSDTLFNFGDVLKDSAAFDTISIYNHGLGELLILEDSLYISGDDANYFEIDSISTFSIGPSDSAFLCIKFNAFKVGQNEAYLNLLSNDPNLSSNSLNLSGLVFSPAIDLPRTIIDFGLIPLLTKKSDTLKIYNTSQGLLTIYYDSLKITGLDSQFFSIDSIISNSTLQPKDSAQIILSYTASDEGVRNVDLIIYSDDQRLPEIEVNLSGSCLAPEIDLSTTSIDFGKIPIGSDSTYLFTIHNTGLGKLILYKDSFGVKGVDSSSYIIDALDSDTLLNSMDSIEVAVTFSTSTTGPKSAYFQITCNDFEEQILEVDLYSISIDNAAASIVLDQNHSSQQLVLHQNGNLRFFISNCTFPSSVVLNYRQGGSTQYNMHNLTDLGQLDMWEVAIDSSWINTKGFEYFVRVYHGWRETDWGEPDKPKSFQVQIEFMQFPETTQKEVYQKISVPFSTSNQTLNELFADDLGSYDNTNYRIFDCVNGSTYTEISNMNEVLPPGKSLWLITKDMETLDFTNAKTLRTDTTFQLYLHAGWNMISTPFDFPINWDENDDKHQLRYYDGSDWPVISLMEPYKGYAVEVESDTVVNLIPKEYSSNTILPKQAIFEEYNWIINLKVDQNRLRDHFNFAGSRNNANDGIDRYDYSEPPPIGNFVALYFLQQTGVKGKTKKFSTDIKSESLDGYIFNFEVSGNIAGKKDLTVEPTNSLPDEFQYMVVNPHTKIKYESDIIELYSDINKLQLMVGTEEFINLHTTDYNYIPTSFRLEQNYPNPFNPSTVIKYQIPSYGKVSMDIYNILGQKVKSLLNNVEKDAGYYFINWDGTNNSGNTVASGIYFLNFRSKHFSKSIKMLLQR